jgi:ATP-dependent Zn protease
VQRLYSKGITIIARPLQNNVPWFVSLLVSWLPFIALIGVWIFLSRQIRGADRNALGNPVFSIYQSDIIEYGSDLRTYFLREFAQLLGIDEHRWRKECEAHT